MPAAPAVDVRGLKMARGGVRILDGVDLRLERGRFLGLIGPNGGGKTTFLRCLIGLEQPDEGRIEVLGAPPGVSREVAYVPQAPTFDFRFPATVQDVVAMGSRAAGSSGRVARREASRLLEELGIDHLERKPAGVLSGGERQRMFLARALIRSPKLLLLDEPTLGVDARSLDEFLHLLMQLRERGELTVLMVTHDFSVVSMHADQVLCLARTIHFCGSPQDLDEGRLANVFGIHNIFLEHRH